LLTKTLAPTLQHLRCSTYARTYTQRGWHLRSALIKTLAPTQGAPTQHLRNGHLRNGHLRNGTYATAPTQRTYAAGYWSRRR